MLQVVIDTNILVSALVFGGTPFKILDAAHKRQFKMVVSAETLIELDRVIGLKFREFIEDLETYRKLILSLANVIGSVELPHFELLRDNADAHILNAAVVSKASYIVTGDKDLLILKDIKGIPIISPKYFLQLIYRSS